MRTGIDARLWNESGVGRYTKNLIEQLQILDHKNYYTLFVNSKDYENVKCQMSNVKWRLVKADIRWHTIEEQFRFPAVLNRERLDLVHFPYFSVPILYNRPYVVTIHDLILHHFPTGLATTLPFYLYKLKLLGYKFVIKRAAQNAKRIITVSNATKSEIIDHLGVPKDKVVVTYEGVESSSKFKVQSSKLQLKAKSYFLYVGNAYPHKNLDRLIKAFEILRSAQNDIALVLVGKEDYFYKRLKEKVEKMHLEKSVLFYGEVSDDELKNMYRSAKALVIPSFMEGFGLPGLEAMINKCLVLASDIPSLREVYNDAAIYFDPYDTKDLVRKMDVILASEERARPGSLTAVTKEILDTARLAGAHASLDASRSWSAKRARMTIIDKIEKGLERAKMFSWEKMAKETLKIYGDCVSK